MPRRLARFIALLFAVCFTSAAMAQSAVPPIELEQRIFRAFDDDDYKQAARLIEGYLKQSPDNPNMLYNAACAYCGLGEADRAADYLLGAVKAGFRDFNHMVEDSDLACLHEHEVYTAILEARKRIEAEAATNLLENWRKRFGEDDYRYEVDEDRRLMFATALNSQSHREMKDMLARQSDHHRDTLFSVKPEYDVLIAVPLPDDAAQLLGDLSIGGLYDHSRRQLISRNIGESLRHEFAHVMHYRHMEQINQRHALWVQEGLASLYEKYDLSDRGSIRFLPNERHNIIKRAARGGVTMKWRELFQVDDQRFMSKANRLYPQVRSMFLFIAEKGKLEAWYGAYVKNYTEDRTGRKAFEVAFSQPAKDTERQWRKWLAEQPMLDDRVDYGDASLGVQAALEGSNDGVRITRVLPRSSASRAGIKRGDVIVAIDGRSTRSYRELVAIIAERSVGDRVSVKIRRRSEYQTLVVTLSELQPG